LSRPKFLLDGMLGKLARWLRIFGFDAEYRRAVSDEELIEAALREGRILLTRDIDLHRRARRRGVRSLLVEGRAEAEKLAEIAEHLNIEYEVNPRESRCPRCDAPLRPVSKEEVRGKVPPGTYKAYEDFWICQGCGKVYWRGSHWRNIEETLEEVRDLLRKRRTAPSKGYEAS